MSQTSDAPALISIWVEISRMGQYGPLIRIAAGFGRQFIGGNADATTVHRTRRRTIQALLGVVNAGLVQVGLGRVHPQRSMAARGKPSFLCVAQAGVAQQAR